MHRLYGGKGFFDLVSSSRRPCPAGCFLRGRLLRITYLKPGGFAVSSAGSGRFFLMRDRPSLASRAKVSLALRYSPPLSSLHWLGRDPQLKARFFFSEVRRFFPFLRTFCLHSSLLTEVSSSLKTFRFRRLSFNLRSRFRSSRQGHLFPDFLNGAPIPMSEEAPTFPRRLLTPFFFLVRLSFFVVPLTFASLRFAFQRRKVSLILL